MDARKDLYWLIFFVIILAIVWRYSGGPGRPAANSGLFLFNQQENYITQLQKQMESISSGGKGTAGSDSGTNSSYGYTAKLGDYWGARTINPQEEYVSLKISSGGDKQIDVTGWILSGKNGLDIKIGQGSYLPYSAQVNPVQDIFMKSGERAYITTGESPIGVSFRLNKCTGYFEQFQNFYPDLPKNCPAPSNETSAANLNDACLDYLDTLPRCKMPVSVPPALSSECQSFIREKVNYSGCVDMHKNDPDFYSAEWRIFLGRREQLWKNKRETIVLQNQNGKIIDWIAY